MVHVTANVDFESNLKIDTQHLNDLLCDLWEESLYVVFYARKEEFETTAWHESGDNFLRVILPYNEIIEKEDTIPVLLTHLAKSIDQLDWLDYSEFKSCIENLVTLDDDSIN